MTDEQEETTRDDKGRFSKKQVDPELRKQWRQATLAGEGDRWMLEHEHTPWLHTADQVDERSGKTGKQADQDYLDMRAQEEATKALSRMPKGQELRVAQAIAQRLMRNDDE